MLWLIAMLLPFVALFVIQAANVPVKQCIMDELSKLSTAQANRLFNNINDLGSLFPATSLWSRREAETRCGITGMLLRLVADSKSPFHHFSSLTDPRIHETLARFLRPRDAVSYYFPYWEWTVSRYERVQLGMKIIKCFSGIIKEPFCQTFRNEDDGDHYILTLLMGSVDHVVTIERFGDRFVLYQSNIHQFSLKNYLQNQKEKYRHNRNITLAEKLRARFTSPTLNGHFLEKARGLMTLKPLNSRMMKKKALKRWLYDLERLLFISHLHFENREMRAERMHQADTRKLYEKLFWSKLPPNLSLVSSSAALFSVLVDEANGEPCHTAFSRLKARLL